MVRPIFLHRLFVSALAILGVTCAQADELRLANGDVLQGKLVAQENGRIQFESPILGTLDVDAARASVTTGEPKAEPSAAGKTRGDAPASARKDAKGGPDAAPVANRWRSKVDFGFNWQEGRKNKQDLSVRFEAGRKLGRNDYRVQTRYLFTKTEGTTSANRRDAALRWRREFNDRWFSQAQTTYLDDAVKKIDLNIDQNVGVGYRVLRGDRASANVGAGVTLQYRDAAGIENGVSEFGEFFQDLVWRFHDRFEFTQEAGALYSPDGQLLSQTAGGKVLLTNTDVPNFKITFQSVLRGKLTESVSVNLRYEYEFDNAVVDRDARSDQRVSTSIGYVF